MKLPDPELHQVARQTTPHDEAAAAREHEARLVRGSLFKRIAAKLRAWKTGRPR